MDILTFNRGSSSLKYQLYRREDKDVLASGIVERVTVGGSFINHYSRDAVELIVTTLLDPDIGAISDLSDVNAVEHRGRRGGGPDHPREMPGRP